MVCLEYDGKTDGNTIVETIAEIQQWNVFLLSVANYLTVYLIE